MNIRWRFSCERTLAGGKINLKFPAIQFFTRLKWCFGIPSIKIDWCWILVRMPSEFVLLTKWDHVIYSPQKPIFSLFWFDKISSRAENLTRTNEFFNWVGVRENTQEHNYSTKRKRTWKFFFHFLEKYISFDKILIWKNVAHENSTTGAAFLCNVFLELRGVVVFLGFLKLLVVGFFYSLFHLRKDWRHSNLVGADARDIAFLSSGGLFH